jgi:hypothetical protein
VQIRHANSHVSCKFANFVQPQHIEELEKPSHDFVQHDSRVGSSTVRKVRSSA